MRWFSGLPVLSIADDVVVSSAAVTQVRSVDPGLKTFVLSPLGSATTVSLTPGVPVQVEVFKLYTDENKVNLTDGDEVERVIQATVTLGAPVNETLTFSGTTVGDESFEGVPPNIVAILLKDNPSTFEVIQVAQWAQSNPDLVDLAGGLGRVRWSTGEKTFGLPGGKTLVVKLQDSIYNPGMNFQGEGPGNAGVVNAVLTLKQETTETGQPVVKKVLLIGDQVKITYPTKPGFTYYVERSTDTQSWMRIDGSNFDGTGDDVDYSVPKPADQRALFVRVVRMPSPM